LPLVGYGVPGTVGVAVGSPNDPPPPPLVVGVAVGSQYPRVHGRLQYFSGVHTAKVLQQSASLSHPYLGPLKGPFLVDMQPLATFSAP
jgi:hypothetical protein